MLRFASIIASDERLASAGGEPARPLLETGAVTGGRWETQSWTRRETLGFSTRLCVFREDGFVVIIMTGADEYGVEGR